jgi:hypothetical protein
VEPKYTLAPDSLVNDVLSALGWKSEDLDGSIPPAKALLVRGTSIGVSDAPTNNREYDFDRLKALMLHEDLTHYSWCGVSLLRFSFAQSVSNRWHNRRSSHWRGRRAWRVSSGAKLIEVPATILIRQGEAMGRPSRLTVDIPATGRL